MPPWKPTSNEFDCLPCSIAIRYNTIIIPSHPLLQALTENVVRRCWKRDARPHLKHSSAHSAHSTHKRTGTLLLPHKGRWVWWDWQEQTPSARNPTHKVPAPFRRRPQASSSLPGLRTQQPQSKQSNVSSTWSVFGAHRQAPLRPRPNRDNTDKRTNPHKGLVLVHSTMRPTRISHDRMHPATEPIRDGEESFQSPAKLTLQLLRHHRST